MIMFKFLTLMFLLFIEVVAMHLVATPWYGLNVFIIGLITLFLGTIAIGIIVYDEDDDERVHN